MSLHWAMLLKQRSNFAANATVDAVGSTVAQGENVEMLAVTEIEGGVDQSLKLINGVNLVIASTTNLLASAVIDVAADATLTVNGTDAVLVAKGAATQLRGAGKLLVQSSGKVRTESQSELDIDVNSEYAVGTVIDAQSNSKLVLKKLAKLRGALTVSKWQQMQSPKCIRLRPSQVLACWLLRAHYARVMQQ